MFLVPFDMAFRATLYSLAGVATFATSTWPFPQSICLTYFNYMYWVFNDWMHMFWPTQLGSLGRNKQVKVDQAAIHGLFRTWNPIYMGGSCYVDKWVAGWSSACHQDSLCYTASAELPMEEAECSIGTQTCGTPAGLIPRKSRWHKRKKYTILTWYTKEILKMQWRYTYV